MENSKNKKRSLFYAFLITIQYWVVFFFTWAHEGWSIEDQKTKYQHKRSHVSKENGIFCVCDFWGEGCTWFLFVFNFPFFQFFFLLFRSFQLCVRKTSVFFFNDKKYFLCSLFWLLNYKCTRTRTREKCRFNILESFFHQKYIFNPQIFYIATRHSNNFFHKLCLSIALLGTGLYFHVTLGYTFEKPKNAGTDTKIQGSDTKISISLLGFLFYLFEGFLKIKMKYLSIPCWYFWTKVPFVLTPSGHGFFKVAVFLALFIFFFLYFFSPHEDIILPHETQKPCVCVCVVYSICSVNVLL